MKGFYGEGVRATWRISSPHRPSWWSAIDTESLAANVVSLEQAAGSQAAAHDHAAHSSTGESQAIDTAKAYIRKLRNALPRALREAPAPGITADSFHAGESLGRSTPKLSMYHRSRGNRSSYTRVIARPES